VPWIAQQRPQSPLSTDARRGAKGSQAEPLGIPPFDRPTIGGLYVSAPWGLRRVAQRIQVARACGPSMSCSLVSFLQV
jgi:hypothetical protein